MKNDKYIFERKKNGLKHPADKCVVFSFYYLLHSTKYANCLNDISQTIVCNVSAAIHVILLNNNWYGGCMLMQIPRTSEKTVAIWINEWEIEKMPLKN